MREGERGEGGKGYGGWEKLMVNYEGRGSNYEKRRAKVEGRRFGGYNNGAEQKSRPNKVL